MAKKETYQEYRTRTQKEISEIQSKIEDEELKKLQYEHQMQRIQNFTEYQENKSRKARTHRLITRGVAIESVCKDVELLDEAEFYCLAENIFRNPYLRDDIARMVAGRRKITDEKEQKLKSQIEDLKEAGYWKSGGKG